jgi:hypothetical protein
MRMGTDRGVHAPHLSPSAFLPVWRYDPRHQGMTLGWPQRIIVIEEDPGQAGEYPGQRKGLHKRTAENGTERGCVMTGVGGVAARAQTVGIERASPQRKRSPPLRDSTAGARRGEDLRTPEMVEAYERLRRARVEGHAQEKGSRVLRCSRTGGWRRGWRPGPVAWRMGP